MATSKQAKPKQHTEQVATSSKITLDAIPQPDIPESITSAYKFVPRERRQLDDEQRARFIHELIGFNPKTLCDDIDECARLEVYNALNSLENWAHTVAKDSEVRAELDTGLHALETLLMAHVEKAFDKFSSWTLRNTLDVRPELEVVLPWQRGLDFARGEFVASQPQGQEGLDHQIDELRTRVEQTRLLSQRLEVADQKLDRRIAALKARQAQVGFVREVVDAAGLSPLPARAAQIHTSLTSLQSALPAEDALDIIPVPTQASLPTPGEHTKAWELGRAAYLNWALGKVGATVAVAGAERSSGEAAAGGAGGGEEKLEAIEREIEDVGGREGVEALAGAVKEP